MVAEERDTGLFQWRQDAPSSYVPIPLPPPVTPHSTAKHQQAQYANWQREEISTIVVGGKVFCLSHSTRRWCQAVYQRAGGEKEVAGHRAPEDAYSQSQLSTWPGQRPLYYPEILAV